MTWQTPELLEQLSLFLGIEMTRTSTRTRRREFHASDQTPDLHPARFAIAGGALSGV